MFRMLAPPGWSAPPPKRDPGSAADYFKLTWFLVKLFFFDSFDYVIRMTRNKITLLMSLILAISVQFNDILRDINNRMW